jgi:hypothetical protein
MPRFEAHITTNLPDAIKVREVGEAAGWKFSQIHGCPIMGDKTYCYLTAYDVDIQSLHSNLMAVVMMLSGFGIVVERAKIERIIFDTKTGVNEGMVDPNIL